MEQENEIFQIQGQESSNMRETMINVQLTEEFEFNGTKIHIIQFKEVAQEKHLDLLSSLQNQNEIPSDQNNLLPE